MSADDRILLALGKSSRMWMARKRLRRLRFWVRRRGFATEYAYRETLASSKALPLLMRGAGVPIVLALLSVCAFDLLNAPATDLVGGWGWNPAESGAYDVLFETVAGVAGVFLALYFTAVSAVAASVYANVPHEIRALIVRDRFGNVYVATVAFAIALALFVLIAHAATGREYVLAPIVVGVLATFSIFAFIRLGQRAFYLADPTLLSDTLNSDFRGWFERARCGGSHWLDPSFQENYRQRARQSVESIASLLDLAGDQPHLRGSSVRNLSRKAVILVATYLWQRNSVPVKSRWFGERYEHKQWYLTSGVELDTANMTSTALTPSTVPDVTWVERPILKSLSDLIDADLAREDYQGAYAILSQLEAIWTGFGESWSAAEGLEWSSRLTKRAMARLRAFDVENSALEPALVPAVWDAIAMLPMSLELGFHRSLAKLDVPHLRGRLEALDLADPRCPYSLGLPREAVETVERMVASKRFEREVGASEQSSTPGWYVAEATLHAFEKALWSQSSKLIAFLSSWYPERAREAMAAGSADAAGTILSRGVETHWKLASHLSEWEDLAVGLRRAPVRVDFKWQQWDWGELHASLAKMNRDLNVALAGSIAAQSVRDRDNSVPDYLGEAVNRVGEACFLALKENEPELFKSLFVPYLVGVLVVIGRIRGQVSDWQPQLASTAVSEPAIDLLDLSGYALIFSELHGEKRLRQICEEAWDGASEMVHPEALAAVHAYRRNQIALTPRIGLRHRWQGQLEDLLEELPRSHQSRRGNRLGEVEHESELIRRLAPERDMGGLNIDASDVFVIRYLSRLDGSKDLDFGVAQWIVEIVKETASDE